METNPQGRFISTNVNYSGNDISPILEWLGDDAGSFVGTEGELNDGLIQFKGYVAIDEAGLHTFRSASDDGSVVFVGNQVVVNNDGGHGAPGPAPDGSAFFPAAGLYPIEVAWFNGNWTNDAGDHGGANIDLTMDGTASLDRFPACGWSTSCFCWWYQLRGSLRVMWSSNTAERSRAPM